MSFALGHSPSLALSLLLYFLENSIVYGTYKYRHICTHLPWHATNTKKTCLCAPYFRHSLLLSTHTQKRSLVFGKSESERERFARLARKILFMFSFVCGLNEQAKASANNPFKKLTNIERKKGATETRRQNR